MDGVGGRRNEYHLNGFESGWVLAPKNPREKNQLLASYRLQAADHRARLAEKELTIEELGAEIVRLWTLLSASSQTTRGGGGRCPEMICRSTNPSLLSGRRLAS